jgi:hypothetical protein
LRGRTPLGRARTRAAVIEPCIAVSDATTQKVLDIIRGIGILHRQITG